MYDELAERQARKNRNEWDVLTRKTVFALPNGIAVDVEKVRLPDGRIIDDYYRLRSRDSAIVVARTADGRLIFERQYKHGAGRLGLTLPAGLIDDGESPMAAARRELLEETGYAAGRLLPLGRFVRNGSFFGGADHVFVADCAKPVRTPLDSGDLEEMEIILLTPVEAIAALRQGEILIGSHAAALAVALLGS